VAIPQLQTSLSRPQIMRQHQLYFLRHAPVGFDIDVRCDSMVVTVVHIGGNKADRKRDAKRKQFVIP